jgi:GIY-YIG catalytic domain-containing protein
MKYIYGLYDSRYPGNLRYIGQTDNPSRRLREHWASRRNPPNRGKEWEHRLTEWLLGLDNMPVMLVHMSIEDGEANRAEHDFIVEARDAYGTGQILNDNAGVSNRVWFRSVMSRPAFRVEPSSKVETPSDAEYGESPRPRKSRGRYPDQIAIREWGLANGYEMGFNNRIPIGCLHAYRAAHRSQDG